MSLLTRAVEVKKDFSNFQGDVKESRNIDQLLVTVENIYHIRDLDTLLERILFEARRFVRADAGTLYLEAKGQLYFNYIQNDTLFMNETAEQRHVYASKSLPVDKASLAGYV
ncbi:MAG: GAF domain-containing protein, partial [Spirochaetales bacterium]|nr:GAF domain-containing protein [Spirochaetales bacterium]